MSRGTSGQLSRRCSLPAIKLVEYTSAGHDQATIETEKYTPVKLNARFVIRCKRSKNVLWQNTRHNLQ